jgi:hypothetical protein
MRQNLVLVGLVVVLVAMPATAEVYNVSLPLEPSGFMPSNVAVPFTFDVGTALVSVNSISIDWAGAIRPAIDYWGEPLANTIKAALNAPPGSSAQAFSPETPASAIPVPFDTVSAFEVTPAGTWDFLLSGSGSGYFFYYYPTTWPIGYPPQQTGGASLDRATLVIDAVPVPEPATAGLLAAAAGAFCLSRRRH